MRVVIDIEANGLVNPDKIWVIVCKDIDTNQYYIFRKLNEDVTEVKRFLAFCEGVTLWIGHNLLSYDLIHANRILGCNIRPDVSRDTLVISKLANHSRPDGHSIEAYGKYYGLEKGDFNDFSCYSKSMETYCIRDVDICHRVFDGLAEYIGNINNAQAIELEQWFEHEVINSLQDNGFAFNKEKAERLLDKVTKQLEELDKDILDAFPPKEVVVREFTPRATKYGTISLTSIPRHLREDLSQFNIGEVYKVTKLVEFNPSSHKQIVTVLNEAGWRPTEKTKTHIEYLREVHRTKYLIDPKSTLDTSEEICNNILKLKKLEEYGWKVNEANLLTLPPSAPKGARLLAQRILLESRRRTLTEWLGLVEADSRIRGKFYGIGAWTHRMAHQKPNTANIPNDLNGIGHKNLLGKEMRQLWMAPKNRLLVGVDAEGIQLRIFAHYIDDKEFTESLVNGKKEDKSDPHSLNKRILGDVCQSRQSAKRFIYALLLGAGMGKLREILECEQDEAERALERLLIRYQGFALLKRDVIPKDAKRGWFSGLDGRTVPIPADTVGGRQHLAMSGYLQNGEALIMKRATRKWHARLSEFDAKLVNLVHDEWQVECPNNWQIAETIAKMMCNSLVEVGEDLGLRCPLAGSYRGDHDYTVGTNWYQTH